MKLDELRVKLLTIVSETRFELLCIHDTQN